MTFTSDSDGRPATIARSPDTAPAEADRLDESEVAELADHFEDWTAEAILAWASERFGERLVISTSFQAEGMVILDMAWRLNPRMRVVTVDSGRLPQETYDLIKRDVERVNETLPPAARVRKFVILHKTFDADEAELTRTRKLRRRALEQKYGDMLTAMYGDLDQVPVSAEVKYRDGRTGIVETAVRVCKL